MILMQQTLSGLEQYTCDLVLELYSIIHLGDISLKSKSIIKEVMDKIPMLLMVLVTEQVPGMETCQESLVGHVSIR